MSHSALCRLPVQGQHSQKLAEPELRTPSSRAGRMHLPWEASAPLPRVQLFPAFFLPRCCSRESASLLTSKVPKLAHKTALGGAHDMPPHSTHQGYGGAALLQYHEPHISWACLLGLAELACFDGQTSPRGPWCFLQAPILSHPCLCWRHRRH